MRRCPIPMEVAKAPIDGSHKAETRSRRSRCEVWHPHEMRETIMPRGDKSSYTDKRNAGRTYRGRLRGSGTAGGKRRAWATRQSKETGGGKKSGSRTTAFSTPNVSSKRGGRIGGPRGGKAAAQPPGCGAIAFARKRPPRRRKRNARSKRSAARQQGERQRGRNSSADDPPSAPADRDLGCSRDDQLNARTAMKSSRRRAP